MAAEGRRVAAVFWGSLLAGAGLLLTAPAAHAGSSEAISTSRGTVAWAHSGDKISVSDNKKDGISIEANYRRDTLSAPLGILHVAGVGKSRSRVWDLFEGTDIKIRMCYRDGIVVIKCSDWQKAEA
ncbi:hypothetical protein [Nocardioides caldifontis]|uniref:hypothetical protein n=1 Tax=Nocardioides caldifontis TaxID=2588938 RepID=UPI0011E0205E|nr:hypothetical protein [Nocardioides caldifontis]